MSSPINQKPKTSKLARMTLKPGWKRKPHPHHKPITTRQPTPPSSFIPNYSPRSQPHSIEPFHKPYHFGQTSTFIPNYSPKPQTNFNGILENPHHLGQTSNLSPQYHPFPPNNQIPIHERQKLHEEINQIHDLSDLLAMHLTQRNKGQPPSSPYSNCLPHSLNLDQVTNHTHYCPCCIFLQKQILHLSEDISWIEYLLTRPHPIPPLQRYNINGSAPFPSPSHN
jgi:hypothetical protein